MSTGLVHVDAASDVAPYEQLRTQLARLVAGGELEPGQKLPTVRQLAADLGLAANTVARAYRELEADGVISTQGRRGTFVRSALDDQKTLPQDATVAAASFAATARTLGLSLAESTRLVENAWTVPARGT
jgi:GntR family transcriptional regulator